MKNRLPNEKGENDKKWLTKHYTENYRTKSSRNMVDRVKIDTTQM